MAVRLTRQVLQVICLQRVGLQRSHMVSEVFGPFDLRDEGGTFSARRHVLHLKGGVETEDSPGASSSRVHLEDHVVAVDVDSTVDNLVLPDLGATIILANVSATSDVRGLDSWLRTKDVLMLNIGAATATLKHEHASAIADNRLINVDSSPLALAPGSAANFVRDTVNARWRCRVYVGLESFIPGYWGADPDGYATGIGGPF